MLPYAPKWRMCDHFSCRLGRSRTGVSSGALSCCVGHQSVLSTSFVVYYALSSPQVHRREHLKTSYDPWVLCAQNPPWPPSCVSKAACCNLYDPGTCSIPELHVSWHLPGQRAFIQSHNHTCLLKEHCVLAIPSPSMWHTMHTWQQDVVYSRQQVIGFCGALRAIMHRHVWNFTHQLVCLVQGLDRCRDSC